MISKKRGLLVFMTVVLIQVYCGAKGECYAEAAEVGRVSIYGKTFIVDALQTPQGNNYTLRIEGVHMDSIQRIGNVSMATKHFQPQNITGNMAKSLTNPSLNVGELWVTINHPEPDGIFFLFKTTGEILWNCHKITANQPEEQLVFFQRVKWNGAATPWELNIKGLPLEGVRNIKGWLETVMLGSIGIDTQENKPLETTVILHSQNQEIYLLDFLPTCEFKLTAEDRQSGQILFRNGQTYQYIVSGFPCGSESSSTHPFLEMKYPQLKVFKTTRIERIK